MSGRYFLSSSSCEPRLGSSRVFSHLGGSCGPDQLSTYAAAKGAVETLVRHVAFILGQHGSGVWNGAVSLRPAIVAFCKQPEDVQEAAPPARSPAIQFATNYATRSRGRRDLTPSGASLEGASRQVCRRRRVLRMERCILLVRLFPASVANVTQFRPAEIILQLLASILPSSARS
jgi:NAD(P)-dependent dehydrogenase (short-subunit alcohol dehydrogenase family)